MKEPKLRCFLSTTFLLRLFQNVPYVEHSVVCVLPFIRLFPVRVYRNIFVLFFIKMIFKNTCEDTFRVAESTHITLKQLLIQNEINL